MNDVALTDLLMKKDIDPRLVFRHVPKEPRLKKVLPWLAAERPEIYNAYQQTQGPKLEAALLRARYVVSCIGREREPGKALFVGLYSIGEAKPLTREQFWQVPAFVEMRDKFGMVGFRDDNERSSTLWFDLALTEFYAHWKGKLILGWPPPPISWWRWADRASAAERDHSKFPIVAILDESALVADISDWNELVLPWEELSVIPTQWKAALRQWRGIYYVWDNSDGKGYVGSAYGDDNILGRWLHWAASGHGGNKLLRQRNPQNLQFSILELVSPTMDARDVIGLESKWKDRLHTRSPFGLNEN